MLIEENRAERLRLVALGETLSGSDLRRTVRGQWTVGALFAHLAYWDRRSLATIEDWERSGEVRLATVDLDAINDAMLPEWLAMPPRDAVREAVAAAGAVDRKVERLALPLVEAAMKARPRILARAIHRREHLDEIEGVLHRRRGDAEAESAARDQELGGR